MEPLGPVVVPSGALLASLWYPRTPETTQLGKLGIQPTVFLIAWMGLGEFMVFMCGVCVCVCVLGSHDAAPKIMFCTIIRVLTKLENHITKSSEECAYTIRFPETNIHVGFMLNLLVPVISLFIS